MSKSLNKAVETIVHDIDALTGFQCLDIGDSYGDAGSMYAAGTTKVIGQFNTDGIVDTDALQAAILADITIRYPLAECSDGSDGQKKYKRVKEAYQRAGKKVFPVEIEGKKTTYDGMIDISFNVIGKKDKPETRKRTVTVELITAVQVQVLADQAEESAALAKQQKDEKKALAEKQEAQSRGTASAADQLKVMQQFMAETFGLEKEREVIGLWLADLNADNGDDIGDVSEGLSQDAIDQIEALSA